MSLASFVYAFMRTTFGFTLYVQLPILCLVGIVLIAHGLWLGVAVVGMITLLYGCLVIFITLWFRALFEFARIVGEMLFSTFLR